MTRVEMYNMIANETSNKEIKLFCAHQIAILTKRNASKNSKKRAEVEARAEKFYNALAEMDKPVTFKQLRELCSDEEVKSYSPQRMSALVRVLGEDRVKKEYIQKDAYFTVA